MSSGPRLVESVPPVFDRIEDILADLAAGKMVVIVDDEDRENEGDLLMAAQCVRDRRQRQKPNPSWLYPFHPSPYARPQSRR